MLQALSHASDLIRPRVVRRVPALTLIKHWRDALPVLENHGVQLRELRAEDSITLGPMLSTQEVARYIAPPPATPAEFKQFVEWTHRVRSQGRHVCYAVIPPAVGEPVGILQIWPLEQSFDVAEWGFAVGQDFWGTGLFEKAAELVLDFAFDTLRVHRLEARAALENGRGNGALRKVGAHPEGVLRRCFHVNGRHLDHVMWAMFADEWRQRRR